jgi:hypothetical protein
MHRRFGLFAALACALLVPSAAQAGTPFTIGEGNNPNVYTQADTGTAHVLWQNEGDTVTYCQVPRGATACGLARDLGTPDGADAAETFLVRLSATTIEAIMPRYAPAGLWRKTSTDNGATWTPAWTKLYSPVGLNTTATQPFILNGEYLVPFSSGQVFGAMVNGSESGASAIADFDNMGVDTATVPLPGGSALLLGNSDGVTRFRRLTGPNPSLIGSWSGETTVPGPLDDTRLAVGPTGAVYLFGSGEGVGGGGPELRTWNSVALNFDAPQKLSPSDTAYVPGVTAGPGGAVAAIWRRNGTSQDLPRLLMAISPTGAAGSFSISTISREDVLFGDANISLAADNSGWAAYEGLGGGATSRIRLVDTSPAPEPPPVTPPVVPPTPPKPPVVPIKVTPPPVKKVVVTSNGAQITLAVPRQCIPSGKPFVATLSWKKQKRKGNRFVKVSRTDFYVGKKRLKIDRKAPFRQTLRIPNPKKGQTYSFRARAFIKMKKGKRVPKKSITTTLKVCA